jgi:hypothetical protein
MYQWWKGGKGGRARTRTRIRRKGEREREENSIGSEREGWVSESFGIYDALTGRERKERRGVVQEREETSTLPDKREEEYEM